jgi:uncharacterized protein (TIGR00255 family)
MTGVQSMTGFANASRTTASHEITCDIRSVNNKGLDIRLRLPSGLEQLEPAIKKLAPDYVARGSIQLFLTVSATGEAAAAIVDETLFRDLASSGNRLAAECGIAPPTADGLLAVRGIVSGDDNENRIDPAAVADDCLAVARSAFEALTASRTAEGEVLRTVLELHIETIDALTSAAGKDPASQPAAIFERLRNQVAVLLEGAGSIDEARLHAEAALLATKADIREEIDRLKAHVGAARAMLAEGGAMGRKLDFLAQEFNRETNTICSKSSSASLTATGLELKAVIDQFREQVQNLQ